MTSPYANTKMAESHGRTTVVSRMFNHLRQQREEWQEALSFAIDKLDDEKYIDRSPEDIADAEIDVAFWDGMVSEADEQIAALKKRWKEV